MHDEKFNNEYAQDGVNRRLPSLCIKSLIKLGP